MFADEFSEFDIVAIEHRGRADLIIRGDLDVTSAPRVIATVTEMARSPLRALRIDCEGVAFLDSAGVRALVVSRNEAAARGVELTIVNPSPSVARVLDMTGLAPMLISA